jgi:hypothetical protein
MDAIKEAGHVEPSKKPRQLPLYTKLAGLRTTELHYELVMDTPTPL